MPPGQPARALVPVSAEPVPAELRDNPIVRFLETMTPAEAAHLEEARLADLEGPPPGTGLDDFDE